MAVGKAWPGFAPHSVDQGGRLAFVHKSFVHKLKTEQNRKPYHCENMEYPVELADGRVKLKAKAKTQGVSATSPPQGIHLISGLRRQDVDQGATPEARGLKRKACS